MTLKEKNDTMRDLGTAIAEAKRYIDNGNDFFIIAVGAWEIRFDRFEIAKETRRLAEKAWNRNPPDEAEEGGAK